MDALQTSRVVSVVGLGYTGLPTAAILASRNNIVHGVEINKRAVEIINSGHTHIVEPQLDMLVQGAVATGRLKAHAEPQPADVHIICVPTPITEGHEPDLRHVSAATKSIAPVLAPGNLVILESTSPPGTTEDMANLLRSETGFSSDQLHVAHAPERVLPGNVLHEVVENDRLIGGVDEASTEAAATFYRSFVSGQLHLTNARTAETVKLIENAFRDVNIAFANEVSVLSDILDLDVWEIINLANKHPRVNMLRPGPGVGGHCIAVDPWFLVSLAPDQTPLIRTAREVNDKKPGWVVDRIVKRAARFREPNVACFGLTYKPNVDDLRESPALAVVRGLRDAGIQNLNVVDPYIQNHDEFKCIDADTALRDADIVVFLTAHDAFKRTQRKDLEEKILIDTCGLFR